jgi:hypothetical protein
MLSHHWRYIFIPLDPILGLQTILLVVLVFQQQLATLAFASVCADDPRNLVLHL